MLVFFFFFFKQKTAYEMRISDWSSDVCSSDLELALMEDRLLRIARREQHLHRGAQPAAFFGDLPARHAARHDNVREQEVDAVVLPEKRDRSEERRVGKECVSTCRSRWSPDH